MKVTRFVGQLDRMRPCERQGRIVLGNNLPVLPNNHGPQTDRLVYGLGPFQGYDSGDAASREVGLYDQPFVDKYIHPLDNGGRIIAGQFDDPYQLDEKGIFDLVNLNRDDLGGIAGARRPPGKDVFTGFNVFSIALEVPTSDVFPHGIPHNGTLNADSTDSLLRVWTSISRQRAQRRSVQHHHRPEGLRRLGPGRSQCPAAVQRRPRGHPAPETLPAQSPIKDVTNFGADILFPVLVRDAEALGIYSALGVPRPR